MPMSIEELEQRYRRDYRRLSVGIGVFYALLLLTGFAAIVGDNRVTGWISTAVLAGPELPEISTQLRFAPPMRTVRND